MLKRIFIVAFVTISVMVSTQSIQIIVLDGFDLGWLATFINGAAVSLFFGNLYLYRIPRLAQPNRVVSITVGVGFVLALIGVLVVRSTVITVLITGGIALGWVGYERWYAQLNREPAPDLTVGRTLPKFTLYNVDDQPVTSTDLHGAPTLWMFYRGNWCPVCMAQIREIAKDYRTLSDRGVQVAFVSPQSHSKTMSLANRFDIPALFLEDRNNQTARQLGIVHENGVPAGFEVMGYNAETVYPTVIITDAEGTILYADQTDDYRVRPEPKTFYAMLDQAMDAPIEAHQEPQGEAVCLSQLRVEGQRTA